MHTSRRHAYDIYPAPVMFQYRVSLPLLVGNFFSPAYYVLRRQAARRQAVGGTFALGAYIGAQLKRHDWRWMPFRLTKARVGLKVLMWRGVIKLIGSAIGSANA